jgi:hypothetical protein
MAVVEEQEKFGTRMMLMIGRDDDYEWDARWTASKGGWEQTLKTAA